MFSSFSLISTKLQGNRCSFFQSNNYLQIYGERLEVLFTQNRLLLACRVRMPGQSYFINIHLLGKQAKDRFIFGHHSTYGFNAFFFQRARPIIGQNAINWELAG